MSTTATATAYGGSGGGSSGGGGHGPPPEYERPSTARRKLLRDSDEGSGTIPTVSSFFPLDKYFDASDKVRETKKGILALTLFWPTRVR